MTSARLPLVHPTAIVDPEARLHESVTVGAYSLIGADVELGEGCAIGPHVVLKGPMRMGRRNRVFQFASLGEISQDKTARAEDPTRVAIGDDNTIREYVTIQRGSLKTMAVNDGETRIGNRNWIMANVHVAHDCLIGDDNVIANGVTLAGHVTIGDHVGLGGYTLVHQFCRIGAHAYVGGGALLRRDVLPYLMIEGEPARPRGINSEGLKRRGFSTADIDAIKEAYKLIYLSKLLIDEVKTRLREMAETSAPCRQLLEFIETSTRSLQR